jgi:aspartyl-tRNA(Asn)/glutamyl-tRNA(Gln) amidotransferase subunit C
VSSSEETVRKLGKLSKLALSDAEVQRFGEQTDRIIGYFRSLQILNLSGVEPTSHVVDIECYRRPDQRGETLKCLGDKFPYLKRSYFQVPRIIAGSTTENTEDTEDE